MPAIKQIVLQAVNVNVVDAQGGDVQPGDKALVILDPTENTTYILPMPAEVCKQVAVLLTGSKIIVPSGPLPPNMRKKP